MITIEAVAFLLLGLFGGRMASAGFVGDYFNVNSQFMLKWNLSPVGFLIDLIAIGGFLGALWLADRGWTEQAKYRYFLKCGCLLAGVAMFFLLFGRISYGSTYGTHDGAVQSEVAAQMLLAGKNPYDTSFVGTQFNLFHPPKFGQPVNPVLDHYAYPPLVPLLNLPVAIWSNITGWPPDGRVMTALAYMVLVLLMLRTSSNRRYRTWVAISLLANPFVLLYPLIGFNDIFFLLFIVATALYARRKQWVMAGAMLGLALAAKQTAWLVLPLWVWWLWQEIRHQRLSWRVARQSIFWTGGVAAVLCLPFIAWNPAAFYDDVIHYVSGVIPYTYPIGGDSLYQFLILFRQVPDAWAATPPIVGLLIAALISFPIGAWWIRRRPTVSQWLLSVVMVTFVVSLANRYLYENYVSALVLLTLVSLALTWLETEDIIAPPPGRQ